MIEVIKKEVNKSYFLLPVILTIGFFVNFYFARMGFMSLDQSIVFDGGWRIFSGQKPFVDFFTPFGLTPYYIQSIFFSFLGVNWYSYCVHSSVFNGLFCIICYFIFRHYSLPKSYALFYSLLSTFVFYPPVGTPFLEQHAFFFGLLSILASIKSISTQQIKLQILWSALVPVFLFLAYFSKQSPSVFFIPLIIFIITTGLINKRKNERIGIISAIFVSLFLSICSLLLIGKLLGINGEEFIYYFSKLPSAIGKERLHNIINDPLEIILYLLDFAKPFKYIFREVHHSPFAGTYSPSVIVSILFSLLCIYKFVKLTSKDKEIISSKLTKEKSLNVLHEIAIIFWLNIISIIFIKLTLNQSGEGVPFVFLSLGLIHNLLMQFHEINYLNYSKKRQWISLVLIISAINLVIFVYKVDMPRQVNDMKFNHQAKNYDFNQISGLQSLEWQLTDSEGFLKLTGEEFENTTGEEFESLIEYLKKQNSNFFLFGDSSILYGLTKKPSINPSILWQYSYGMPEKNSLKLDNYQLKVIENLKKYDVKIFIQEGKITFMKLKLSDFPILENFLNVNKCSSSFKEYGAFKIYPLCYDKSK